MLINNSEIVPIFDTPHIFKCIRNNLMDKHLEVDLNSVKMPKDRRFAKKNHIKTAYEMEVHGGRSQRMPNLTEKHMSADQLKKMSVKHAAQTLSSTVGNEVSRLTKNKGSIAIYSFLN